MPALIDQFRKLRRRRLVAIGGPGSGKTQPRVQDWLAGQLAQTYSDLCAFRAGAVQKLADQELLLPVLDGLDKMPTERWGVRVRAVGDLL